MINWCLVLLLGLAPPSSDVEGDPGDAAGDAPADASPEAPPAEVAAPEPESTPEPVPADAESTVPPEAEAEAAPEPTPESVDIPTGAPDLYPGAAPPPPIRPVDGTEGPGEVPEPEGLPGAAAPEPPPPSLDPNNPPVLPPDAAGRRLHRCLPGVEPCLLTTERRLFLAAGGLAVAGVSTYLIFNASDRNKVGDPTMSLVSGGLIAVGSAVLGGAAALLGDDGPALYDRLYTPTISLSVGPGGSSTTDESVPYALSGSLAPTLAFPRNLGRIRLVSSVGGDLGSSLDRDPRPQTALDPNGVGNGSGGSFDEALGIQGLDVDLGIDLAIRLPPRRRRGQTRAEARALRSPDQFRSFELRYKPLFFIQRDRLNLGGEERINQRVALTPLNVGARWQISPRQRFTFYMGPRWDMVGHGTPGAVQAGKPALGAIYSETWFDLDIPLLRAHRGGPDQRNTWVVSQLTLGYIHSRLTSPGYSTGAIIGFFGHFVVQYAVRFRPRGSIVAYQVDLGARVGAALTPFLRLGVVLPDITPGARRR